MMLLAVLLSAIEVHAAGDCPAGPDVARKLAPLLDAGSAAVASDVATIERTADGLLVSLNDGAGHSIGQRRFPRAATCGDAAETVAVTLAIWEAQLHPEITLRLDRLSPSVPPLPAVVARVPAQTGPPRDRAAIHLGVAAAGDWQPGSWAPAGRLELAVGRAGGRWRAHFAALGFGRHTLDVAPGQAIWWRAALSLGADLVAARSARWALVLGGGGLVGVASISGRGYTVDRTSRSVDTGGELGVRSEWGSGLLRPWVGVSVAAWLRQQTLELQGVATGSALPRVEPTIAAGADFVW
jgi:hypothetical protein